MRGIPWIRIHSLPRNLGSEWCREQGEAPRGRKCYIGIGHRALLPVGCVASVGAGRCELPAPVRISS